MNVEGLVGDGQRNRKINEMKIFTVPIELQEIKENITISINTHSKPSQEQIINHAFKFHSEGKISQAGNYYKKIIDQGFKDHRVFSNYGIILKDLGKLKEAELSYRKAIEIKPDFAIAHSNLGNILREFGSLQEAEVSTRRAIKLNSNFAEAYSNLGSILRGLGNLKEAESSARKAIELNPYYADAHLNLGGILIDIGNLKEAELSARKAIELNPYYADAHSSLGIILNNSGNINEAINCYEKAIKLNNKHSQAQLGLIESKGLICEWGDQDTQSIWLKKLGIEGSPINPHSLFCYEDDPLKHLKRCQRFYQKYFYRKPNNLTHIKKNKIHIGYFSSDFQGHATMYLIASILELHDKTKFEIYLYSFTPKEDKYTERAKASGCFYRNIKHLSIFEAVKLAREDKLDIAVDLKGYTKHCRMNIFSYRVAPIQINYLGYPGSLGADTIDYILADKIVIPKKYEKFYSEKVIRMPSCYQCNDNTKEICKEPISRQNLNLPEKGFIFTCFNANKKITPREFDIWMRLLSKIKGSVIWLYKSNKSSVKNLMNEAEKRNIDSNRLIFANKLPLQKHLARHTFGDLALDTFNCNGHTTTSDALWAGLPVLTKIGESFAARVSASLLTSLGMPELITHNEKEYEEKALFIARNPDELKRIKTKLAKLREISPLYNSELFTKNLEYKLEELLK